MSKNAFVVGLAMVAATVAVVGAQSAAMPKDPCALLKPADIQPLAGAAVKDGTPTKVEALGAVGCTYEWTGAAPDSAHYQIHVLATDASKAFPGMSTALIKQALLARVRVGGLSGEAPGIGDAATFESDQPTRLNAKALAKGVFLSVELEGPNARLHKDEVVGLLKIAVGRL